MIWSKYSYLFQEGDRFYLYNSLSNSFAELDRDSYTLLCKQSEKKNDIKLIGGIKIRLKISIFYGEKVVHLADF